MLDKMAKYVTLNMYGGNVLNNWQRDPKWKNNTIGTSTSTFGNFGCLLSAIGNLADKTPVEVNDFLNSHNGFVDGDLVVWEALRGLEGIENADRFPRIAKVKANFMHFVVALDNENIIDPYYGEEAPATKRYQGIEKFYNWTSKGGNMGFSDENMKQIIEKTLLNAHSQIKGYEADLNNDINFRLEQIKKGDVFAIASQENDYWASQNRWVTQTTYDSKVKSLEDTKDNYVELLQDDAQKIELLKLDITNLKKELNSNQQFTLKSQTTKELIQEIFERIKEYVLPSKN